MAKSGIDFAELLQSDDPIDDGHDDNGSGGSSDSASLGRRSRSQSLKSSMSSIANGEEFEEVANEQVEQPQQLEASSRGKVEGSIFGMYLKSGANWFVLSVIASLFLLTQVLASGADYWVSYW